MMKVFLFSLKSIRHMVLILILFSGASSAANSDVQNFINSVRAPTYDCPDADLFEALEATLAEVGLTQHQYFALSTAKSQFLVCEGKFQEAQHILFGLLETSGIKTDSYAYASALYQVGFIYDVMEKPERCDYYQQAKSFSSPKMHSDVYMSASLGLITYCSQDDDKGEILGKLFTVLEGFSGHASPGELAHIHNSIGLVYGELEQHSLAAEQYLKAHEMGLQVYEGSNKLSILISAIVSLLSSGQSEKAYQHILEYGRLNEDINTPLTNFHFQYALSYYYRKTRNFTSLENTLPDFERAVSGVSSSFAKLLYRWHKAEVCLYNQNIKCMNDYLASIERQYGSAIPSKFKSNLDYLGFNIAMQLALNNIDGAKNALNVYARAVEKRRADTQDSARIMGVANLYTRIHDLESEIYSAEQLRKNTIYTLLMVFLILSSVVGYLLRRKFVASKARDSVTGLLNADFAISLISRLEAPKQGRTIAVAVFDIKNFEEITQVIGLSKNDYVLRRLAQTLQQNTRGNDIVGRFGSARFILCLRNIEERNARSFFSRTQKALNATFENDLKAEHMEVDSSFSMFIANEKIIDLDDILDDLAMSI